MSRGAGFLFSPAHITHRRTHRGRSNNGEKPPTQKPHAGIAITHRAARHRYFNFTHLTTI